MEGSEWDDDDEDDDYAYWEERAMSRPDYELPSYLDPSNQYWDEFYDGYDDEEEYEDEEDDFYDG